MTCPRTPPGRTTNNHYYAGGMCIFCAAPETPAEVHLAFPEKRSDEGLSVERLEAIVRAHRRIRSDEHGADWCGSCGTDWPCNTSRLVAALAASRADNERISAAWAEMIQREQRTDNAAFHDVQEARAEAAAARVEVSQLRAKVEALCVENEGRCTACGDRHYKSGGYVLVDTLRAALAEPLGSTPDQPATEEKP